jgi:release factor glutamine methyltransferase
MRTVLELLNLARDHLGKNGVEQPRLDSEILLCEVTGKKRLDLYLDYNQPLTDNEVDLFREYIRQRASRKPVQYIIGETEFFGLKFKVNEDVLIPRPETELMVEKIIDHVDRNSLLYSGEIVIFDMCTGSGCIAVSLAKKVGGTRVYASDISKKALEVAAENVGNNSVESKITFLHGDLEQAFGDEAVPRADILVSNPPYVSEADWAGLAPEVAECEPRGALYGGADGLDILRRIVPAGLDLLKEGGSIFLEIGWKQDSEVEKLLNEAGYTEVEFFDDLSGIRRIAKARKS